MGMTGVDVSSLLGLGRIRPFDSEAILCGFTYANLCGIMAPGLETRDAWVDITSYMHILEGLECSQSSELNKRGAQDVILITGVYDPVAITAELDSIQEVGPAPHTPDDPNGNLILRGYHIDPNPVPIYEVRFTAIAAECSEGEVCPAPVDVILPIEAGAPAQTIDKVELVLAADGTVLAQKTRTANPPVIAFINPTGGAPLVDDLVVTWSGSDLDGDTPHYILRYSWDGGQSYVTLADTEDTSFTLDTDVLPGSDAGMAILKLSASDGLNTVETELTNLTLDDKKPPTVFINSPATGQTPLVGSPVILSASANDPEDGTLNPTNIVWTSDLVGLLGSGPVLTVSTLPLGVQAITVTATDSDGMQSLDLVNIEVIERPPGAAIGDTNFDAVVDAGDIDLFIWTLFNSAVASPEQLRVADANQDQMVDGRDAQAFVDLIITP